MNTYFVVCTSSDHKCDPFIRLLKHSYLKHFGRFSNLIIHYSSNQTVRKYPPYVKLSIIEIANSIEETDYICLIDPDIIFQNNIILEEKFKEDTVYAIFRKKGSCVPICPWRNKTDYIKEPIMTFEDEIGIWKDILKEFGLEGDLHINENTIKYCQTAVVISNVRVWRAIVDRWRYYLDQLLHNYKLHKKYPYIKDLWVNEQVAFSLALIELNVPCEMLNVKYNYQNNPIWERNFCNIKPSLIHYAWRGELDKYKLVIQKELPPNKIKLQSNKAVLKYFLESQK